MASNVSGGAVAFDRTSLTEQHRLLCPSSKPLHCIIFNPTRQKIELSNAHLSRARLFASTEGSWLITRQDYSYMPSKKRSVSCYSRGTRNGETEEYSRQSKDCANLSRSSTSSLCNIAVQKLPIDMNSGPKLLLLILMQMDGKGSVSLLAECSSSPDVSTRQALANALAVAPSMWILGNAGMGALQRLAQDSNPAIAAAASKAIDELKQQWELEEGDSLIMMNSSQECGDESDLEEGDGLERT